MSSTPVRIHLISRVTTLHSASAERPDHPSPTFPYVEQRRRDPVSKPRSRRCFVCGTTGRHPLDFRVCPRTAVLLRRSLAKLDNNGRLVSIDGSPLPMTRHPGGVAAHIISRFRNPTRIVVPPAPPYVARFEFPHAVPPIELFAPAPAVDRVLFPSISTLFALLLDNGFRSTVRAVVLILDSLYAADPPTFASFSDT
ncbi:hypothetical protein B0H14DRAFT_3538192 [Mycena olivaceomarginata]|nr:hypothetical protein B0H14DRAFT_3538192 [Mycena olivaceomarginata]